MTPLSRRHQGLLARHQGLLGCVAILVYNLAPHDVAFAQASCPNPPLVSVTSSQVPSDVCVPSGFPGNPIQFFDDFSWKSFVALVWPALTDQRGKPDPAKKVGDTSGPLVFETFKADWELFQADPTGWNSFPTANPCGDGATTGFNDFLLASFSKFGNLGEAGFGNLVHALPAQNKSWVRYSTAFNETEYNQIFNGKLYILSNLKAASPLTFQNGSLNVKSSWIVMTGIAHPERYYSRVAKVMDPVTGACSDMRVGLVGLHVVQKTPSRPQWIWSSFEHVDNVPPAPQGAPTPPTFAFNDGTGATMPPTDPNGGFPPDDLSNPKIYNVARIKPIHPSTQTTNAAYRTALGGVWQFYQLVMTQWPVPPQGVPPEGPVPASQPGSPNFTFPGTGATTAFANTTLETWDQNTIFKGCMNCHNVANANSPSTDFVWTLQDHALTSAILSAPMRAKQSAPLAALKRLLEEYR
jgi:hypothetical protein